MCCRISMGITKMVPRLLPSSLNSHWRQHWRSYSAILQLEGEPGPIFFFFFTRRSWQPPRAFLPWFVFYSKKKERERMNKVLGQQTRNSNALRMPCGKQNFRWGTLPRSHDCCKALYFPLKGSLGLERKLAEQKSSKSSRAGHKKRTDYVLLY